MGRDGERKRLGRGRQGLDRRKRAVVGEVEVEDESNIPCDAVIEHVVCGKTPTGMLLTASGRLASATLADSPDEVDDGALEIAAEKTIELEKEEAEEESLL